MKVIVKEIAWGAYYAPATKAEIEAAKTSTILMKAGLVSTENVIGEPPPALPDKLRAWLRLRAIPFERVKGRRAVIDHVHVMGDSNPDPGHDAHTSKANKHHLTWTDPTGQVRPQIDEHHKRGSDGEGLWEADGEERVFEYTFMDPVAAATCAEACATMTVESELLDLSVLEHIATTVIERELCLKRSGHSRCHKLKGHDGIEHHHIGGKVWHDEPVAHLPLPPADAE